MEGARRHGAKAMRGLLVAAWVLPGLAAGSWLVSRPRAEWTSATLLEAGTAYGWAALPLSRGWRRFALATAAGLSVRIGFVAPFVVAALATLLAATTDQPTAATVAVLAGTWPLAGAGLLRLARTGRARLLGTIALLGFNALLLAGLDRGVRRFVLPHRSHNLLFVDYDPLLGWKLRAGAAHVHVTDAFVSRETINTRGFRSIDPPADKPPGVRRVVVLGDSHSEGYTVDDDATWTSLLEATLAREHPTQVVNLGVGGYATDQELLSYLQYGRTYHPDLVLLQFCSNDVRDNASDSYWRGMKPYFERFGETLLLRGTPVPDHLHSGLLPPALLERSGIAMLLDVALSSERAHHQASHWVDRREAWHVTALILRDLRDAVRADGADFAVLMADPDERTIERKLRAILAGLGVPYVDIAPIYANGADAVRVRDNPHWNAAGHRAVAELLAPVIEASLERKVATASAVPAPAR